MSAFYPTMGLEIHAELLTKSKVFCTCSAEFGGTPNSRCCPVCSGMPGTLPVLNQKAVEYIIKAGYVMNCDISRFTKWDRKNYFYPDLPKAYQISQMPRPVCLAGTVKINVKGEEKVIRINRIHLEEDAGKLVHDEVNRISLADYNRCGIPLIEIVTEPDFHSSDEVIAFLEKIKLLLQYAGICDCKMEQGSIRCDVNISIAPKGSDELGTRTELKNLNSLKAIARAIEVEIERQEEVIENSIPELPEQRVERYVNTLGLKKADADIIVGDKRVCDFFDEATKAYDNPKAIANYIVGELMRRINLGEVDMDALKFTGADFARLVELLQTDKVSQSNAKIILGELVENGGSPDKIADERDLWIKEDNDLLAKVVDEIIANNPKPVEQYKSGDQKVFGFFMGQANKALKGAASPKAIQDYLRKKLSE